MTAHSLSISIVDDNVFEAKYERFSIGLFTNVTGLRGLQFRNATLTIIDDDGKLITFSILIVNFVSFM